MRPANLAAMTSATAPVPTGSISPGTAGAEALDQHAWRTLAIASLAGLAAFLDTTVLFVAFPDIVATFDTVEPAQIPASLALILRAVPAAKVPFAVAIWGATGAVAGALGPTLGAALVEAASWRWVFFINLPIGIVTIVAGRRVLHESRVPGVKLPAPLGVALIAGSASLIALGLVQSSEWGWTGPKTLGTIFAGLVMLALFVWHQSVTRAPALDLDLFRIPNFSWGNTATLAFGTVFAAMFFSSILFLTDVWDYSILRAGIAVAPGPALVAVLAPRMGALAGRVGQRPLLIVGSVVYAAGGAWRLVALSAEPSYLIDYLPSMLLTGIGVALCLPQLASVVAQSLPPDRLGVGGGVNQAIRQFGGTLGVALTIAFLGAPTSIDQALDHFDRIWLMLVVGALLTTLLVLPIRTGRRIGAS